jgi:hypothetical protein
MTTPSPELIETAIRTLLQPERLFSASEVLARPSPVPKSPGVYAWYFDELPSTLPIDEYHRWNGYHLLYVGIAPGRRTPPSTRTLRHRLRDHFAGNAEGSTLRKTLGCLLSDTLNIRLRRVGSGKRQTFTNPGERELDKWMAQHARVTWTELENPWLAEEVLLSKIPLPLNMQGNQHAFCDTLEKIRRVAAETARTLEVIRDNGGPRRIG